MKSALEVRILNSDLVATKYRMTRTGPIAVINGAWCSVNGDETMISDIRFQLTKADLADAGITLSEARGLAYRHLQFCQMYANYAAGVSLAALADAQDSIDAAQRNCDRLMS